MPKPVPSFFQLFHLPLLRRRVCRFLLVSTMKQSTPPPRATHSGRTSALPPTLYQGFQLLPL